MDHQHTPGRSYPSRHKLYQGFVTADDIVYLNLEAGNNEIVFAVYEVLGDRGLTARFDDPEDLTFE